MGFAVAVAGGGNHHWVDQAIIETALPTPEGAARERADGSYVGTYVMMHGLDSSLTIFSVKERKLNIASWTNNGTDFLQVMRNFGNVKGGFRMFLTHLERKSDKGKKITVRFTPDRRGIASRGPLSGCRTWFGVDCQLLGSSAIDELVFEVDQDGKATSMKLRASKAVLARQ